MRKRKANLTRHPTRVTIHKPRVATLRQDGSFAAVWVAAFTWNGWQASVEYTKFSIPALTSAFRQAWLLALVAGLPL